MNSSEFDPRAETARFLGLPIEEIDYLDKLPQGIGLTPEDELPPSVEEVSDIEVAAAESRGLVVPNRISYGVDVVRYYDDIAKAQSIVWWPVVGGPGPNCRETGTFASIKITHLSRSAQEGWCPARGGGFKRRYKIWWRYGAV